MVDALGIFLAIAGTIFAYLAAVTIYKKIHHPLLLPVAIATIFIIIILISFRIPYKDYMVGAKWIDAFLGPAVVSLAYPLYRNREVLKRLALPMLCGTFAGAITGITSGILFAKAIHFPKEIIYSITPKSVTTPVAMDISNSLTGISSLSAVFVMIAGISGAMMSTVIFKVFKMQTNVALGVGIGSASHAIGTAKALENNLEQGSISTIAMILSAVFVSVLAPPLVFLLM